MEKKFAKRKTLEVTLFDNDMVEIESELNKNVSIEIKRVDLTDPLTPKGALYQIQIYKSEKNAKKLEHGYDLAYVMSDGKILKYKETRIK